MGNQQAVTNEDILKTLAAMQVTIKEISTQGKDTARNLQDFMQMTGDGFGRLETRMDRLEKRIDSIETELKQINTRLREHDVQLADLKTIVQELSSKHSAYLNDIADILDRITALEQKSPNITKAEVRELQDLLQTVVDWAIKAARIVKVPLKLRS